jgi:hypothetical protein
MTACPFSPTDYSSGSIRLEIVVKKKIARKCKTAALEPHPSFAGLASTDPEKGMCQPRVILLTA